MRIINTLFAIKAAVKLKLFRKSTPFLVYWSLTDSCNAQCKYCSRWKKNTCELPIREILLLAKEMITNGTKRVVFTGGEPILREDISDIVNYFSQQGVFTTVISNGLIVKQKIKELKNLGAFVFSLDGPEKIQDYIRGEGSYKKTVEAIKIAKEYNIKVNLISVITKANLNYIDHVLSIAKEFNTPVSFQPIAEQFLDSDSKRSDLFPSPLDYRKVIHKLISKKKMGNRWIMNSLTGLYHLLGWPSPRPMVCSGGLLSCRVDTEGYVGYCDRPNKIIPLNCLDVGFKNAFRNLSPISCDQCWCGMRVELNYLLKYSFDALYNLVRM